MKLFCKLSARILLGGKQQSVSVTIKYYTDTCSFYPIVHRISLDNWVHKGGRPDHAHLQIKYNYLCNKLVSCVRFHIRVDQTIADEHDKKTLDPLLELNAADMRSDVDLPPPMPL